VRADNRRKVSLNETSTELNLRDIFFILKKHIILIVIISISCAIIAFIVLHFFVQPKYKADATLVVNAGQSTSATYIGNDQLNASAQLVKTCAVILSRDSVLEKVIQNLGLSYSTSALRSEISITGVSNTVVLDISVTDHDAELAAGIANELADLAPDILIQTVKAGSVESVSPAKPSDSPSSSGIKLKILIAFFGGLVVAVVLAFILESLNNTFTTEDDIRKYLDLPLLGVIPSVNSK
jgi:capsular polysaccharide biosynthesis protein